MTYVHEFTFEPQVSHSNSGLGIGCLQAFFGLLCWSSSALKISYHHEILCFVNIGPSSGQAPEVPGNAVQCLPLTTILMAATNAE